MLFNEKKLKELLDAIKNKDFPIIVCGPSGTGKTFTIQRAMEILHLKSKYVDISRNHINKTMINNMIIITELHNISDLRNVNYFNNVIIESNLLNLNKLNQTNQIQTVENRYTKLTQHTFKYTQDNMYLKEGETRFKIINFKEITQKAAQKFGIGKFNGNLFTLEHHIPQENNFLTIYHFLGKIFYKKLDFSLVTYHDEYINYEFKDPDYKSISIGEENRMYNGTRLDAKTLKSSGRCCSSDETDNDIVLYKGQKKIKNKRFIDSSSDDCEINESCSLDDSFKFSSDTNDQLNELSQNAIHSFSIDNKFENSIKFLKNKVKEDVTRFRTSVSFSVFKLEKYIYENFLHFIDFQNLFEFYDCISQFDTVREFKGNVILKSIILYKRSSNDRKSFYSFKLAQD